MASQNNEVTVEIVAEAEVTVQIEQGAEFDVEVSGPAELNFIGDGVLDGYYDKNQTDALLAAKANKEELAGKANVSHNHDGRYYTEDEADVLLGLKVSRSALLDLIYPVGSVYMSANNVSPQSFLGGEWEQIKDTFLLSAGDTYTAGDTGGEATHELDETEIPAHRHGVPFYLSTGSSTGYATTRHGTEDARGWMNSGYSCGDNTERETAGTTIPHNNMPPYLVVYVWQRTA